MNHQYLTAGQFAKLARTTKRTILWYQQAGILMPVSVSENGYRCYEPRQILDYQIISLLRALGFSLEEISSHITGGQSLMSLFTTKKVSIARQIEQLQAMHRDLESYSDSLADSPFLVQPHQERIASVEVYYLPVVAPYAEIKHICSRLAASFSSLPDDATFLTIFEDNDYKPQAARLRVGVIKQPGLRLKAGVSDIMTATLPAYYALVHKHRGDGSLLSLLWTELGKYRRAHGLAPDDSIDFYELERYRSDRAGNLLETEMHLPIAKAE